MICKRNRPIAELRAIDQKRTERRPIGGITGTFLWALTGAPPLPPTIAALVRDFDNPVVLSAASAWEIAVTHAGGRLKLPDDPARFVPRMRAERGDRARADDPDARSGGGALSRAHALVRTSA